MIDFVVSIARYQMGNGLYLSWRTDKRPRFGHQKPDEKLAGHLE